MPDWSVAVPVFFTATVLWVEAFTIVLAVSLGAGWRTASGSTAVALLVLTGMMAATGGMLRFIAHITDLQFLMGALLLLFGIHWLAKAVARRAGLKPQRDEAEEFAEVRTELSRDDQAAAWFVAFKGILLKGSEIFPVAVALGSKDGAWGSAAGAVIAALLAVAALGAWVKAPLTRVPENAIKLLVSAMIVAVGTFWSLEALGGTNTWPLGDWSLPVLAEVYLLGSIMVAWLLRSRRSGESMP